MTTPTPLPATCPCGHELAADDGLICLIRDRWGETHRVQRFENRCRCHMRPLAEIENNPPEETE